MARSHRLRLGRHSEPGRAYHVATATAGRRPVFQDVLAGRQVVRALRCEPAARTLCYCVMPDHLHWLFQLDGEADVPGVVRRVKGRSARWIGMAGGRLWQPGYFDHALRREEDLRAVARYIVANPLRSGLVSELGAYPLWDAVWL